MFLDFNECSTNNGGCSNLCLAKPGGRTCACANGYYPISKQDTVRLRSLISGVGSGAGSGTGSGAGSGINMTKPGPDGSGQMSGPEAGSGFNAQTGPSLNSTVRSDKTRCSDEEMYNLLRSFS